MAEILGPRPRTLKKLEPERRLHAFLSVNLDLDFQTAEFANDTEELFRRQSGAPGFFTVASTAQVMVTSRSVAVSWSQLPSHAKGTFERTAASSVC